MVISSTPMGSAWVQSASTLQPSTGSPSFTNRTSALLLVAWPGQVPCPFSPEEMVVHLLPSEDQDAMEDAPAHYEI